LKSRDTSQFGRGDQSSLASTRKKCARLRHGQKDAPMAKIDGGIADTGSSEPAQDERAILVICPTHRDLRELPRVSPTGVKYLFRDYASISLEDLICNVASHADFAAGPLEEIEAILDAVAGAHPAGVISTDDYPGSALAAAIAKRLGLPGPDPAVTLICQHKYLARVEQAKIVPDAVPPFALIEVAAPLPRGLRFPLFVKPVKSFFSIGAERVDSASALAALFPRWAALDPFFAPLEEMLQRYTGLKIGTKRLIAEGLLKGEQVTVEGFVHKGRATIMGIVDSVMFPGTLAFSRFDYPSSLPESVQRRMALIATNVMAGLGFDNGMFNIEMIYDAEADLVSIIEINPRMASQFADLYEKVDGTISYAVLLDIALGRAPQFTRRQGRYAFASSIVLRSFEDSFVVAPPTEADLGRLAGDDPDGRIEILATAGRTLSSEMQDGNSYRYGIVTLGGRDRADVLARFAAIRVRLGIVLKPMDQPGPERPVAPQIARLEA
jgi:ATP-grasp domain